MKIIVLCVVLAIIYGLPTYGIVDAFKSLWTARNVTLYYAITESEGGVVGDGEKVLGTEDFCKTRQSFPKGEDLKTTIRTVLINSLLPNFKLALKTQPLEESLIKIQSLHLNDTRLILDLSKEFYMLNGIEEVVFIARLLLNVERNFKNIEEVYVTIDGNTPKFVNGVVYYGSGLKLEVISGVLAAAASGKFVSCPKY
ncbi:hypothetical protein COTS27_01024 [Spirochaetota bacterium]|nr:hypothetical protein COTS27_01024 [Spirochaetota bacterium]